MENLNAEQVKNCLVQDIECGCGMYREADVTDLKRALALINLQEQRIADLETRLRYLLQSKTIQEYDEVDIHTKEYVKDIHSLDANIKGLTEEKNEVFEKGAENLNRVEEAYLTLEAENLKLTEENEGMTSTIKILVNNNADLEFELAQTYDLLEESKADTVREMQERLDKRFCHDPAFLGVEQRLIMDVIDQIAKEMLEDAE